MSKMEEVRAQMVLAMKSGEKERKEALSMLLAALKAKFIDKREDLTEEEENAVVLRELKQTKETLESAPADRTDIREQCERRTAVLQEFAPREMSEEEIRAQIQASLAALGIEQPTARDKGRLMKELMPRVKGKADGALVNRLVTERLS